MDAGAARLVTRLGGGHGSTDRIKCRGARHRLGFEQIVEPQLAPGNLGRVQPKPFSECSVGQEKTTAVIDRIESDRGMIEEIDEASLLFLNHLFELASWRDVIDLPEHRPGRAVQGIGGNEPPLDLPGKC